MGVIYQQAKMLLAAVKAGVPMTRALMIGRQSLLLHPHEVRQIRKICPGALENYKWGEFADRFFSECLGVSELNTLDYSAYEGANLLYDLNQPIPDELKNRFDVVLEAGSIEHVFNFPVAIANLMKMTKVGGTIFTSTVSNNLCGHGFYQFSPELIFRVFTPENGFRLGKVLALEARFPGIELAPISKVFEVADPARVGERVGLMTKYPIMLLFDAQKLADSPLFSPPPMQSDYTVAWNSQPARQRGPRMPQWLRSLSSYSILRKWLTGQGQVREYSLNNKRFFKQI